MAIVNAEMSRLLRRARGLVLRLAGSRPAALVAGALLLMVPLLLVTGDHAWESWVSDGVGLVCGATGAALVLTALSGRRPDWIEAAETRMPRVQRVQEGSAGLEPSDAGAPTQPSEPSEPS